MVNGLSICTPSAIVTLLVILGFAASGPTVSRTVGEGYKIERELFPAGTATMSHSRLLLTFGIIFRNAYRRARILPWGP